MDLKIKFLLLIFAHECVSHSFGGQIEQGFPSRERRQISAYDRSIGEKIEASGGGIVKKGSNVTLSLYIGSMWDDRCMWFRYDHAKAHANNKYDYCSFDFDEETNTTNLHKCDSAELKAMITPISDDPLYCKIMLVNFSSEMEGKWAARLTTDMVNKEIQLIMEEDVKEVSVQVKDDSLVVGENASVICTASGGKPDPVLSFMLMDINNTTVNSSIERFDVTLVKTEEENKVTYVATFVPTIEDLGRKLCCKSVQQDLLDQILYETNKVLNKSLDVKFPPIGGPDGVNEQEAKLGETVTLTVTFKSNPGPEEDKTSWSVLRAENCSKDDIENTTAPLLPQCTLSIKPGHVDDKFIASNITQKEDHVYMFDLQVLNVDVLDYLTNFTAHVANLEGQQTYNFHLSMTVSSTTGPTTEISGSESTAITEDGESVADVESSPGPGLAILMIIVVLMGIIGGIVYYKRRKGNDIEQTPLTQTQ